MGRTKYIGEILMDEGLIAPEQLREALSEQKRQIGQILIEKGYVKPEDVDRALRLQVGISRSERYARWFRYVLVVALMAVAGLGWQFMILNQRAQFIDRLGAGALGLDEVRGILDGRDRTHAMEALRSLERFAPEERRDVVVMALQSDRWYIRLFAVLLVSEDDHETMVAHLVPLTMSEEPSVLRFAAREALIRVTGEDKGSEFSAWFRLARERGIEPVFPERLRTPRILPD